MPSANSMEPTGVGADLALRRLFFEEPIYGSLRIAFNDQPFLLGSWFTLLALRLWFFWHLELLSHWFSVEVESVPQPGLEPGRPDWSRGCKPRASANSATGAYNKALIIGTVTPAKTSPVPALFGPISATLTPSSLSVLHKNSFLFRFLSRHLRIAAQFAKWMIWPYASRERLLEESRITVGYPFSRRGIETVFIVQSTFNRGNPLVADCVSTSGLFCFYFALLLKSFQAIVNRRERLSVLGKIKSEVRQTDAYIRGGKDNVALLTKHHADTISELNCLLSGAAFVKGRNLDIGRVFFVFIGADYSQAVHQLFPMDDLGVDRCALLVDLGACCGKFIQFLGCDH
jgi:hypothetical protein